MLCRPRLVRSTRSGSTEATLLAVVCVLGMMVAGGFLFFRMNVAQEFARQGEAEAIIQQAAAVAHAE